MLFRLSRMLFWMAAAAAAAALFGPPRLATALTAFAGLALLPAYGLWRLALSRDRQAHLVEAQAAAAGQLDEAALRDIARRVMESIAASPGVEPALHAAAATLRTELGAQEITVHRVLDIAPPIVTLVTLVAADAGAAGVEHRVRLDRSPLGESLRDGRVAGRGLGPYALPVRAGDAWVAVIELGEIVLQVPPGALEALFELTRAQLAQSAHAASAAQAASGAGARDFLTPPAGRAVPATGPEGLGCRRQYPGPGAVAATGPDADAHEHPHVHDMSTPQPRPGGTPDVPAAAVLDPLALERLRELDPRGESQLIERVLKAFETSAARLGPQLEASRRSGDRAGIRHVAHTLKSSSASIGALTLSRHCAAVEAMIREDSSDDLEPPLAALGAELEAVLQALRSLLDKPA